MMEFLIASAIGVIFSMRWSASVWPVGGGMVAAIVIAASQLFSLGLFASLALTIAGYNAGLLAGVLLQFARGPATRTAPAPVSGNVSSKA